VKTAGDIQAEAFTQFASRVAPRLTNALVSLLGFERGQDAAWDALTHAWENWEKMTEVENPVGYLYVVGRNGARSSRKQRVVFPDPPADRTPGAEDDRTEAR
jgi:DNA-directed RNA polymerase specialized sigma24 family protein